MAYVQPVPSTAKTMRKDQGQDYQGKPGDHVVAIGNAHVDAVKSDPKGFGVAIYYTLLDGPAKGQQIYVGHAAAMVKPGQVVQVGQPVAVLQEKSGGDAANLPGWTEVGLAHNGRPMYAAPVGGDHFQALLKGSGYVDQTPTVVPTPAPTDTGAAAATQTGAAPVADSRQIPAFDTGSYQPPTLLPPGSGPQARQVAEWWQQIASQPFASPEAQSWAQNVSSATGG
jgi:hypothetical protein